VTIRIGNASAPRWYDLDLARLDGYIERIVASGATSTEIVLHHGAADEAVRRVHLLEEQWWPVIERYHSRDLLVHVHAPLHPRFKLSRWRSERDELRAELLPVLRAVAEITERQGEPCVLIVHGASGLDAPAVTAGCLEWIAGEIGGARISIELRDAGRADAIAFDRSRDGLVELVEHAGIESLGICWDIAHDWESASVLPGWAERADPRFLAHVNHVHLHNVREIAHQPLQFGDVPWRSMLAPLLPDYRGAITMEIRYRCALALGEPWAVLQESYRTLTSFVAEATRPASD
jgi:sugar phosphate isomerase/epimerase